MQNVKLTSICIALCMAIASSELSCAPHEHIDGCGAYCQLTCDNYQDAHVCPHICGPQPTCVCNDGYVRNTFNDKCVQPRNCPPQTWDGKLWLYLWYLYYVIITVFSDYLIFYTDFYVHKSCSGDRTKQIFCLPKACKNKHVYDFVKPTHMVSRVKRSNTECI